MSEVNLNGNTYTDTGSAAGRDLRGADGYGHRRWLLPMLADAVADLAAKVAAALGYRNEAQAARDAAANSQSAAASSASSAQDWAAKTSGEVVAGQGYGAKKYANDASGSAASAQDWATKTSAEVAAGQGYGAKKYAQDASASATAAAASAASIAGGPVASVNGMTGIVTLTRGDLEAAASGANTDITSLGAVTLTAVKETRVTMAANDINLATGNYFTKTISGATTLTVSNVPATGTAAAFILDLTNGGSATITLWAGVKWVGGTVPALTAAGRDVLGFFTHDGGTTWTALLLGKDVK